MVERLKAAIERAKAMREATSAAAPRVRPEPDGQPDAWSLLTTADPAPETLERRRVVAALPEHRLYESFNVLRTRIGSVCREAGWRRIGVTSPTQGCGKTSLTANLAYCMARNPGTCVVALDLDLRSPNLRQLLGLAAPAPISDMLTGRAEPEAHLLRLAPRLAVGLNDRAERHSAEMLGAAPTGAALAALERRFAPDVILCDLPPISVGDDVLAAMEHLDGVILVAAAGETTSKQVREAERGLEATGRLIGVVFNKCRAGAAERDIYYDNAASA